MFSDFVDGNDPRMVEPGRGFRFHSKAPKLAFGGSGSGSNQFEGDTSVETDLARVENDTHAAFGDFPHQHVIPEIPDCCLFHLLHHGRSRHVIPGSQAGIREWLRNWIRGRRTRQEGHEVTGFFVNQVRPDQPADLVAKNLVILLAKVEHGLLDMVCGHPQSTANFSVRNFRIITEDERLKMLESGPLGFAAEPTGRQTIESPLMHGQGEVLVHVPPGIDRQSHGGLVKFDWGEPAPAFGGHRFAPFTPNQPANALDEVGPEFRLTLLDILKPVTFEQVFDEALGEIVHRVRSGTGPAEPRANGFPVQDT